MERLAVIARVTKERRRHAFGFAWIDRAGRLRCYKQQGRISSSIDLLRMAAGVRFVIGHCRWVTQGSPADNINNHPHPCDGGWIVHNGQIHNYASVLERFNLWPNSDCDSEVLALRIEQESGRLLDAVLSVEKSPLVVLGLWKPGRLVAVRQGNPLSIGVAADGFYLGSLPFGLPGKVSPMPDDTATLVNREMRYVAIE